MTIRERYDDLVDRLENIQIDEDDNGMDDEIGLRYHAVAEDAIEALEPLARPEAPHVRVSVHEDEGGCDHCGARFNMDGPMPATEFVARINAFVDEHAQCPPTVAIRQAFATYLSGIDVSRFDYRDLATNLASMAKHVIQNQG